MATAVHLFLPKPSSASSLREAHPYGPTAAGFHTDLGIEIDPSVVATAEAVAVVSGWLRLIPDAVSTQICSAVLMPNPQVVRDLSAVLGKGIVVFVYRNLLRLEERPDRPATTPAGTKQWPDTQLDGWVFTLQELQLPALPVPDPSVQWSDFINGKMPVVVDGGITLFPASPTGGANGWGYLGFEIVFIPGGLWTESLPQPVLGWDRLKALIDPAAMTRRLDPAAFYRRVAAAGAPLTFNEPSDHSLLTQTTRRTLLEVRDEYDEPITETAYVYDGGQTTPFDFDATHRATVELPATVTFSSVELPDSVFTELPTASGAQAPAVRNFTTPDHWCLQAIFMSPDPDAIDEPKSWFAANTSPLNAQNNLPLPRYTEGNKVTVIRDGVDVFREYIKGLYRLAAGDTMFLSGWVLMDDFDLLYEKPTTLGYPNFSIHKLLTAAAGRGAKVRALIWEQLPGLKDDVANAIAHINALPNNAGQALADAHPNFVGSHHQKLIVLRGEAFPVAFCGGVDINRDRRDTPNHGAIGPFHDVHAKVQGPAVRDLFFSFRNRWNSIPDLVPMSDNPTDQNFEPEPAVEQDAGGVYVQVACTYSRGMACAPDGSTAPLNALLRAIGKARKFVYIEDQYLTPYAGSASSDVDDLGVLNALRGALGREKPPYIVIVLPNHTSVGWDTVLGLGGQCRYRRQQFINALLEMDPAIQAGGSQPSHVHAFYLARVETRRLPQEEATDGGGPNCSGSADYPGEIYCHSKVWIVDDVIAKIGSANCNRRSYTHDSEMDIVMVDGAVTNGVRTFARNLRMDLWAEHLGFPEARRAQLEDPIVAIQYLLLGPDLPQARLRRYEHNAGIEIGHTLWNQVDPDGR